MRLLTLGLRLAGTYNVVPVTADPDSATGDPTGQKPLVGQDSGGFAGCNCFPDRRAAHERLRWPRINCEVS
jgi:hypothetical protein